MYYIYVRYKNICYYKCKVNNEYFLNKYYVPFCSYDIKYKAINFYGYFNYTKSRRFEYQVKTMLLSKYKNEIYNTKVNISIKKLILRKRIISLCIVSIFRGLNIKNIIRTCLLYKLLGVEHVTLYLSYYDNKYNKYYIWIKKQNWIDIIYILPPKVSTYYSGQESKLDHCINHYRYISRYVIVTDVDEIIMPISKKNILEIVKKYGINNYVFSFKSVVFNVNSIQSSIFSANKRGCKLKFGYEKMILRPEKLISIGAHFPQKWQEKGEIITINTKDAYVRHARMINKFIENSNCTFIYQSGYLSYLIEKIERIFNKTKL